MKIKKIVTLVAFTILLSLQPTSAKVQKSVDMSDKNITVSSIDPEIIDIINMINQSLVLGYLEALVNFGPKPTGSENCNKAAQYIFNEFEKMGLYVEFDPWKYPLREGKNVVARLNGNNNPNGETYIVCAHYDTTWNSPGANDDCSGVAAMLSIAKIMSQYFFNNTICFLATSGHELWPKYLYGGSSYAKEAYAQNENILSMIMLDGFGNTTKGTNVLEILITNRPNGVSWVIQEIANLYNDQINITVEPIYAKWGEHQSFIEYGYDAATFITRYVETVKHTPRDDLTHIDMQFLTNATKLILAVTVELAKKTVDLQVRLINPKEGHIYIFDYPFELPYFNLRRSGLRTMTYIIGGITIHVNITTSEEITSVYYLIDGNVGSIQSEPPYDYKIKRFLLFPYMFHGKHILSVTVTTLSGKTAYDEMDFYII